jgi:cell division protein FtsX
MNNSELNSQINNETALMQKLTKSNKDIENVAIGFVSVIILLFLLVIFNSIRNKSGLVKK